MRASNDDTKRAAVGRAALRIATQNAERDQAFRDTAMGEIRLAQDAFRAQPESELTSPGTDPLLDALMEIVRSLDGSPEMVAEACDRALEVSGVLPTEAAPRR